VREFLRVIADDASAFDGETTFEFVHGQGSKAAIDLDEIGRSAREARDDEQFARLVIETSKDQQDFVAILGRDARRRARQVRAVHLTTGEAKSRIEWITNRMYRDGSAPGVRDRLAVRFAQAAEERETIDVKKLQDELVSRGAELRIGPIADLTGLSMPVQDALAVLSSLEVPVPLSLLANVVGAGEADLSADLEAFISLVEVEGVQAVLLATPLGAFSHPRCPQLLAATLRQTLDLAADRSRRGLALSQVRNIARLAEQLLDIDPVLVASVYPIAERLFKTRGHLQLALKVSRVTLRATERPPTSSSVVTNGQLRDRAQTKICGESWVLQRIGELDEADRVAAESLELGRVLGWDRNTAYCLKCRGRLLRMRAEQTNASDERISLLSDSETHLRSAITEFGESSEFGHDHPEVGDCHSLLARTLFVAGRRMDAWRELIRARDRLDGEVGQKDWADALILEAELLAADGERSAALADLDQVLNQFPDSADADATEITARALATRGRIRGHRDRTNAALDHGRSAELYELLDDHYRADEQEWAKLVLENAVPPELADALAEEDVQVRVAAVRRLEADRALSTSRAVGQRSGLSAARRRQMIIDARLDAERRESKWR
jgi:tetratricopeptide (TPR) repeat protein